MAAAAGGSAPARGGSPAGGSTDGAGDAAGSGGEPAARVSRAIAPAVRSTPPPGSGRLASAGRPAPTSPMPAPAPSSASSETRRTSTVPPGSGRARGSARARSPRSAACSSSEAARGTRRLSDPLRLIACGFISPHQELARDLLLLASRASPRIGTQRRQKSSPPAPAPGMARPGRSWHWSRGFQRSRLPDPTGYSRGGKP